MLVKVSFLSMLGRQHVVLAAHVDRHAMRQESRVFVGYEPCNLVVSFLSEASI